MLRTVLLTLSLASGLQVCPTPSSANPATDRLIIEHVTVLSMAPGAAPMADATVFIADGRITRVAQGEALSPGDKVTRIDGRGRYLLPGFADMHVHVLNRGYGRDYGGSVFEPDYMRTGDLMLPFLANGVTQILEMSAMPETLAQASEIESGAVLGPHVATAAMVDGEPPVWALNARTATTPEAGRQAVREIAAAGYDFVKVYARLSLPVFEAVVEEAQLEGLGVVGHAPAGSRNQADAVLRSGLSMLAHIEELPKLGGSMDSDVDSYGALARGRDISIATTLTTDAWIARQTRDPTSVERVQGIEYLHPLLVWQWTHANRYTAATSPELVQARDDLVVFTQRAFARLNEDGVRLLPGTDSIVSGVAYGFSLHDELSLMVSAGMTPRQALESATRRSAEFLGVSTDRGTVEAGKRADLVLLDADPLADIANTRAIAGVIVGGRYLTRVELDARMADLAERYRGLALPAGLSGEDDATP
ncbi:MAG: amidohydrolase [Brevundimonas sp.]|nr:MAG: amidohydrolase [Brevundimonas sp.]